MSEMKHTSESESWVEWTGGERPVAEDAVVEVKFRSGHSGNIHAGDVLWDHYKGTFGDGHIIAYRAVQP